MNLGFNKENIINIHLIPNKEILLKYETLKHEFSQHPDVIAACTSDFLPGKPRWNMNYWHEGLNTEYYPMISCIPADYDFLDTFEIKIVAGRGFSRNFPNDEKNAFIINESAAKEFGWLPRSAIGKAFNIAGGSKKGYIIGVVQNFHFNSLHREIKPLVLYIEPMDFEYISIRVKPVHTSNILEFLKNKWQEIFPGQPFVYSFLDDDYDSLYKVEFRLRKILALITILALSIAGLGLIGLASFAGEQRRKEIGVRKVHGASVPGIVLLLSKEFTLLVLAANIFAWPVAWYAMNKWLQNFSYRITISPWVFLLSALFATIIALITVSYKVFRAAIANPVETLRYE
jgi:putative ABC transport system permease protein